MAIRVRCPECETSYNFADTLAGKKVRCKKCQAILAVPQAEVEDVSEASAAPPANEAEAPKSKTRPAVVRDEQNEPRPAADQHSEQKRRPRRPREEDEEDTPPPKKPATGEDDNYDEESPRREKKKSGKRGSSKMLFVLLGGGVLLLALLSVGGYFLFRASGPKDKPLTVPAEEKDSWTASDPKTADPRGGRFPKVPYKAYRVELKAGQSYRISLFSTDKNFLPGYLIIEDQHGKKVGANHSDDRAPTSTTDFTPPADGEYRLVAITVITVERGPTLGPFTLKVEAGLPAAKVDEKLLVIQPRTQFNLGLGKAGSDEAKTEALFLSADGGRVAVSNRGVTSRKNQIWDLTGPPKKLFESEGHAYAFSPDGKRLVRQGKISSELVEVDGGKKLGEVNFSGKMFFRSPDALVVVSTEPLQARELDGANGKLLGSFKGPNDGFIFLADPVKDGKELIIGVHNTGTVQVWDLSAQKLVREFPLPGAKAKQMWSGYTVSPDGKWIAAQIGGDPVAKIFNAADGNVAATLPRGVGPFNCAFLPGRDVLLVPSNVARSDKNSPDILAYDINKQSFIGAFRGHEKWDLRVAVSADGKVLAVGNEAGNVLIWDLAQLK